MLYVPVTVAVQIVPPSFMAALPFNPPTPSNVRTPTSENLMLAGPSVSPESAKEYPPLKLALENVAALTVGGENIVGPPPPPQETLRTASPKAKSNNESFFIVDLHPWYDLQQ
jgi:hypothetical protein